MPEYLYRALEINPEVGQPIKFVASTGGVKRDGRDLDPTRWLVDNFRANPVVLWFHGMDRSNALPIGRADVQIEGGQLTAEITFDQGDPFAQQVERKYRDGFLHAVSVGWVDIKRGKDIYHDLTDISAVPVPADPQALKIEARVAMLEWAQQIISEETRGNRGEPNVADYLEARIHSAFTWEADDLLGNGTIGRDERIKLSGLIGNALDTFSKGMDEQLADLRTRPLPPRRGLPADTEQPDATVTDVGIWEGVATAMVACLSPDTAIEDTERRALYNVLERAYRRLGRTAPEWVAADQLAALGPAEWGGLFLEGEMGIRAGAVLNARNKQNLREAARLIKEVLDGAGAADDDEPPEGDENQEREAETLGRLLDILNK